MIGRVNQGKLKVNSFAIHFINYFQNIEIGS